LDLPLPTAYHLLRTLVHEGYLRKLDDGYVLGSSVDSLGQGSRLQGVVRRTRAVLQSLRDELHGAIYLSLYDDGEIRLVDIAEGPNTPCADLWVGVHEAGHATAFGKCVLASLDKSARDEYLSRHRPTDLTPRTITDVRVLERTLHLRPHLVADREEYLLGIACVAAPVGAHSILGALAVSVPAHRLPALLAEEQRISRAAERVSRALAACG
jgi:DNA-binding IclR family transcriptional regulator